LSPRRCRRAPGATGAGRRTHARVPARISGVTGWDGDDYQRRFDALAAAGHDVHGEADFVMSLGPASVLDAGCGTGRVAIELARRGVDVVGVDVDPGMLATARSRAPEITWVEADLTTLDLGRTFDVVVLAGNVPLFTPPGTWWPGSSWIAGTPWPSTTRRWPWTWLIGSRRGTGRRGRRRTRTPSPCTGREHHLGRVRRWTARTAPRVTSAPARSVAGPGASAAPRCRARPQGRPARHA